MTNPVLSVKADGRAVLPLTGEQIFLKDLDDPAAYFLAKRREYGERGLASVSDYYGYISADTTHNCNLRCQFCFDDFSSASRARMTREDFVKLVSLAELAPDGMLFLSCLYEPFLHPGFADLLQLLPEIGRRKCFFTTNLCVKRLKDEVFEVLARANLLYMNVSLDSLVQPTFEHLRVNADFEVFRDNLGKLARAFREAGNPPALRFISMALRSNYAELPDLVRITHEEFGAAQHEIRMPFQLDHASPDWSAAEQLSRGEWDILEAKVAALPYPTKVWADSGTVRYHGPPVLAGVA